MGMVKGKRKVHTEDLFKKEVAGTGVVAQW